MFNGNYIDWNHRRIKKIIDHYGHPAFADKTVLDLGCGVADIGGALARLGAHVTAVDARQDHLNIAKKKYPHINTLCVDLDKNWPFANQKFDYVINLGLICHLTNYKQIIEKCCSITNNLILESEICDSNDPNRIIKINEHQSVYDWALNGIGHKPSASNIEDILKNSGMSFKRIDSPSLNSGPYKYDWKVEDTHNRKIGHRRFWFVSGDGNQIPAPQPKISPREVILNPKIEIATQPTIIMPEVSPLYNDSNKISSKDKEFKVAVCISGYMRCFDRTFERLYANLLKDTNPDIFIHTWENVGAPLRGFDTAIANTSIRNVSDRIYKLYNPVKMVIEPAIKFPITPLMSLKNFERRDINGVLSMFYKIKKCNDLKLEHEKSNGFKYDCVVRIRTDLMFMSPFFINKDVDMNCIYIPNGYDYGGLNDQVAFGNSEMMDKYATVFDRIKDMLAAGESFNPEKMLQNTISHHNIPVKRTGMHYYIKRFM